MRRTEGLCISQFVVEQVAGDDRARAGEPGALHDVEPDAAAPDHQHAVARGHPRVTNDGADAGGDAAADDRRMGEWQVLCES